ncbi:hypothetical protein Nepgr_018372 [Nepenthes gracilis]|uniref:Uncharacterized protein n=1 Tax=Nepenthes gracilis TaxID=150966 RepID=A0AAD3XU91_NEPGR|nr:hypothetical protein Nepgr_018372 [Nepenthes gracilis]
MGDGESPPYWEPPATIIHRSRRSSSPFLNSSLAIVLLPSLALLFIFVAAVSFATFTGQNSKPNSHTSKPISVKRSWDSLNIVLVLLALLCGVFASRRNDDESSLRNTSSGLENSATQHQFSAAQSHQNVDFSDRKIYAPPTVRPATGVSRLRSINSYPDLRQEESSWENAGNERLRFFDDFDLNKFYPLSTDYVHRRRHDYETDGDVSSVKDIPIDTFVLHSKQDSPSPPRSPPRNHPPPPPPSPPTPPASHNVPKRTYQTLPVKEKIVKSAIPNPPPQPIPSPAPRNVQGDKKRREDRRKSNATKEIASAIALLYNQRKWRRGLTVKQNNETSAESLPPQIIPPASPPPPPPPPLPPPPSVFHNLFKIGSKSKKIHSMSAPPQPPPPPVYFTPGSRRKNQEFSQLTSQVLPPPPISVNSGQRTSISAGKPPVPVRPKNFYNRGEDANKGGQSPLTQIPPPPPPPFPLPEMTFVGHDDFVQIRSVHSSRCSSPQLEDVDMPSNRKASEEINGGNRSGPSMSFPGPDVNVKADTFIARHHNGWRLEKLNSWRERQRVDPGPWPPKDP